MKKTIFIVLLMIFTIFITGTSKFTLTGILPPDSITVDKTQLYISSGLKVSIFSLKDLKQINNFGKKGEGPGEFLNLFDDVGLMLNVLDDKLFINSGNKITYYSKNGEFLKELRVKNGALLKPVGENYVGFRRGSENNIVYNYVTLFDKSFKRIKDLYKEKYWYQQGKEVDPVTNVRPPLYYVYKNLIYSRNDKGNINIFNSKGALISKTSVIFKTRKVTSEDKKKYDEYYRIHPVYKQAYAQLINLVIYPKSFPKIKYFDIADSNLYVFTYIKKDNKSEIYIFDLKGKFKKKLYLNMPDIDPQVIYPVIKIKNNKIYQIIENEEDEESIDLHITDIKF